MKIAVDKNQVQKGSHAESNKYNHMMLKRMGHELFSLPLPIGDYCILTDEMRETIDRRRTRLKKMDLIGDIKVAVDRKNSIDEICGNVCSTARGHERFRDECILAQKCGCKFYVLVEDENIKNLDDLEHWVNPREKKYFVMKARQDKGYKLKYPLPKQPPASGKTLAKALRTMQEKYGIEVVFAKPKDAARVMVELLTEEGD